MQQALGLNYLHTISNIACRSDKVQSGLLHLLKRNSIWDGELVTPTVEREEAKLHHHPKLKAKAFRLDRVEISCQHVIPSLQFTKNVERGTFQAGFTKRTQITHPIIKFAITQSL